VTDHVFTPNPAYDDKSNPSMLTPWLYLAGAATARNHALLAELGISCVVNLTKDDYDTDVAGFATLKLHQDDADDIEDATIATFLEVMDGWERDGAVVLIHCFGGVSRTAAFAIAWLMHKAGANRDKDLRTMWSQAEDRIGRVRPIILPHYLLKRAVLRYFEGIPS
jgi:hypothetical protein